MTIEQLELPLEPVKPEEWRPVVGYEGYYEVSDQGRVRSVTRVVDRPDASSGGTARRYDNVIRKPSVQKKGYKRITLCKNGKQESFQVHRLALIAFKGPCPQGCEACHNDGNPGNNEITNLRWDFPLANARDTIVQGRRPRGEKAAAAKLTADDVRIIRGLSRRKIDGELARFARSKGVSRAAVSGIARGLTWKHVQ